MKNRIYPIKQSPITLIILFLFASALPAVATPQKVKDILSLKDCPEGTRKIRKFISGAGDNETYYEEYYEYCVETRDRIASSGNEAIEFCNQFKNSEQPKYTFELCDEAKLGMYSATWKAKDFMDSFYWINSGIVGTTVVADDFNKCKFKENTLSFFSPDPLTDASKLECPKSQTLSYDKWNDPLPTSARFRCCSISWDGWVRE